MKINVNKERQGIELKIEYGLPWAEIIVRLIYFLKLH